MPTITLSDGSEIFHSHLGDGPELLVLLPQSRGPAGSGSFLDGLAEAYSVTSYHQLGTGLSGPVMAANGMSMAARADEVVGLMDELGIERANLCCHSTGCGVGLTVAAEFRKRVDRLILVNPWEYGDAKLAALQKERIKAARTLDPHSYAWFNASLLFPLDYRREHEEGFERIAWASRATPQDPDQIAPRLQAILAFDARPLYPKIVCPTLVITSADDPLMPARFGQNIARAIRHARLVELPGGGHMLPETRTKKLLGSILDFLPGA